MAEDDFGDDLAAVYDTAPAFADEDAFATGLERRFARRQTLRRFALGGSATAGGAVALAGLVHADVLGRLIRLGDGGQALAHRLASQTAASPAARAISAQDLGVHDLAARLLDPHLLSGGQATLAMLAMAGLAAGAAVLRRAEVF